MESEMPRSKKRVGLLLFLCWLAYTAANIGRMDYSASMVAIIEQTNAAKNAAGLVASFFFFAYGIGQLINGIFCHKYNPRIAIFCALILSAAVNAGMSFCRSVTPMKYLWLINGCVQSILWSSLIRIQSRYIADNELNKSILIMSTTAAAGTFAAYGLSALFVMLGNWRITFIVASGVLVASGICWFFGIGNIQKNLPVITAKPVQTAAAPSAKANKAPLVISLAFVAVFALSNGFIKDGITTWVPNLLYETHNLKTYFSILLTLILPLFAISGAYIFKLIRKKLPNDVLIAGLFLFISGGVSALILLLYTKSLGATVALFAVLQCCTAALNNILVSSIPVRLRTLGNSGRFAGIINTFVYMGSTISSFLLGWVADHSGWNTVMMLFIFPALTVAVIAISFSLYWKKQIKPLIRN